MMDRLGIATSLLSISSPGVHLGDERGARPICAREMNEAGRRAVVDHPGRFGLFASLPLPDVDAAIAEIAYCCDRLDVAGFAVLTNVGGTYLGDPAFRPVFRELDRRGARVFIHPTSPACWEHTSLGRPRPMLEFLFDTTRAVVTWCSTAPSPSTRGSSSSSRTPERRCRWSPTGSHVFSQLLDVDPAVDVLRDLGRLHFDLAGFPVPRQLDALLTLTTLEHLHYGSDYPFTPEFAAAMAGDRLAAAGDPPGSLRATLLRQHRTPLPRPRPSPDAPVPSRPEGTDVSCQQQGASSLPRGGGRT